MIELRSTAEFIVYGKLNLITDLNAAFFTRPRWTVSCGGVLGIGDFHDIAAGGLDGSPVTYLAAGFAVKGVSAVMTSTSSPSTASALPSPPA